MRRREPKIYATLRNRFSTSELVRLGFRQDGYGMVKRGACRAELAVASPDGLGWRVTPLVRQWR